MPSVGKSTAPEFEIELKILVALQRQPMVIIAA